MAFLKGFLQLFSAPTLDSTEVQKDDDLQYKCRSCRYTLKNLFVALRDLELQQRFLGKPLGPIRIHENYRELAACAQQCVACRIFRKALILKQPTTEDAAKLEEATEAVFVTLLKASSTDELSLRVSIGRRRDEDHASALVSCTASNAITSPSLHPNPCHLSIAREAKSWLDTCTATHTECGNLRSSSTTPTRLLEIFPDSQSVQLIHPNQPGSGSSNLYPYAALSYCWGPKPTDSTAAALVNSTLTIPSNLVARSTTPFPTSSLSATIRDTIVFVASLGTRYIWIDALCIMQGPGGDWETESAKMHEVYGNAAYTLCIASNDAATKPLFTTRTAWEHENVPCRLAGSWWIAAYEVEVEEVRRKAPLARRAWTLQEERLSPRVLYWAGQRMYWSCVRAQRAEMGRGLAGEREQGKKGKEMQRKPKVYKDQDGDRAEKDAAQGFLETRRKDSGEGLHRSWLGIVESYTRRQCTNAGDRFPALSGLAAKYLEVRKGDEYLAGLWKQSLAEDLSWSPSSIVIEGNGVKPDAPSWSWASLPFGVGADWKAFSAAEEFEMVTGRSKRKGQHSVVEVVNDGAKIQSLHVRGRLRLFKDPGSISMAWSDISQTLDGQEKFSFAISPDTPIHSVDLKSGRVLTYEALREEVIGQLDYFQDTQRIGHEDLAIFCLEIGSSVMLLLEHCEIASGYRRIGVSRGYRVDFFLGADVADLKLL